MKTLSERLTQLLLMAQHFQNNLGSGGNQRSELRNHALELSWHIQQLSDAGMDSDPLKANAGILIQKCDHGELAELDLPIRNISEELRHLLGVSLGPDT